MAASYVVPLVPHLGQKGGNALVYSLSLFSLVVYCLLSTARKRLYYWLETSLRTNYTWQREDGHGRS